MCDVVKIVTNSRSKCLGCEAVTVSELAASIFCVQKCLGLLECWRYRQQAPQKHQ